MSCLDEGNIAKYAGKDLGTILELGPEEKEEAEEEDDEEDKGDETNSQKVEPATVRRQRLTAQQTSSLAGFLKARENVPSSAELREWARRQGRLFGGGEEELCSRFAENFTICSRQKKKTNKSWCATL